MKIENLHKLITREDKLHIHKILGFICLVNFIYRFYLLFYYNTMYLDNFNGVISIIIHGFLSCSSMIFHVPNNRIKSGPMIYQEARLHSIIFSIRSVLCFLLTYYNFSILYKFAVCYLTMILADLVTNSKNINNSTNGTTMRNMPFDSTISNDDKKNISFIQSGYQIGATLYMFGNLESCFSPLLAIQLAAFLMTLVRKNIINSNMWHIYYNIFLLLNTFIVNTFPASLILEMAIFSNTFQIWRFNYKFNKYLGWSIIFSFILIYYIYFFQYIQSLLIENNLENIFRNIIIWYTSINMIRKSLPLFEVYRFFKYTIMI